MRDMFTTTTDEEKHSGLWSNPRESLVVLCPCLPSRWALKWLVTLHVKSNRISWNVKEEKYPPRSYKIYPTKLRAQPSNKKPNGNTICQISHNLLPLMWLLRGWAFWSVEWFVEYGFVKYAYIYKLKILKCATGTQIGSVAKFFEIRDNVYCLAI